MEFEYALNEANSEFCGIIMGDGNIWSNGRKYEITITGDKITDKEYFDNLYTFIDEKIKKHPYYRIRGRGLRLTIYSKQFYQFITSKIGIPPRMQKRQFGIPTSIICDNFLTKKFIRGLFDTDGSVFTSDKKGYPNYPSLEINNSNQKLLKEVYDRLINFGFRVHYRSAGRGDYKVSIYGRIMIKMWLDEIGSSNPHKLRKINSILESLR